MNLEQSGQIVTAIPQNGVPDLNQTAKISLRPVEIDRDAEIVRILGVPLPLHDHDESLKARIPSTSRFKKDILTDYDLLLMQQVAVALDLNQPFLFEGGSGLGKSRTVERVCACAKWPCFYVNCHDFTADVLIGSMSVVESAETGFGWVDGLVLQAIRHGGVLFLDEYNFMRGDTRGRLHEMLDAPLKGKKQIILIENGGEVVDINPNFRIIAAQNPPGGEYLDREILDPAQLSRFVYRKEPADIPEEEKMARTLGRFGLRPRTTLTHSNWLRTDQSVTIDELVATKEQRKWIAVKLLDAHQRVQNAVDNRKLAAEQPQQPHMILERDRPRILSFMLRYFDGSLPSSLHRALRFYLEGLFETQREREQAANIISQTLKG